MTVPFVGDLQTLTYRNDVYTGGAPATWDELIAKGKEGVAAGKIKYPVVFRGVSKALIGRLEAVAAELGLEQCNLESTQTALRFYRELGYVQSVETYTLPLTGMPATVLYKRL